MERVELTIDEIKECELGVLKFIDQTCRKLGLKYYLSYGSLLGAVRHKGFIPWDDDIDIQMPREDMEKLMKYFEENDTGYYKIKSIYNDKKYICTFPKVFDTRVELYEEGAKASEWGPFVDIFPIDKLGMTKEYAIKRCKKMLLPSYFIYLGVIEKVSKSKNFLTKIIKNLMKFMVKAFSIERLIKNFDKKSMKDNNKECNFVGVLTAGNPKGIMPRELYEQTTKVEFEGEKFIAVKDYDYFLTQLYGADYMQIPSEEKRICHKLTAFWK